MARKNDLKVSPAQEAVAAQQIRARVESPSTNNKDQADTGGNGGSSRRPDDDDDDTLYNGTIDAGNRHDELDTDDAEDIAGLINDASLSGAHSQSTKPADKPSAGTFSRTLNYMTTLFVGSSQKPAESSSGNNNPLSQSSASLARGKQPQIPPPAVPDNSTALSGDKTLLGKSLARPSAIYEDISKLQKPRRSGRPDPYEVPQSPPTSPAPEPKLIAPKGRGPKPKRAITRELPEQVTVVAEETPYFAEEELSEAQEHVEHTEVAHGRATRAIPASEERNAWPKRATRSTRISAPNDLEEFQRQRERYQRNAMKESREHLQISSPTQSSVSISKVQYGIQDAGNQAGLGLSRTKTQSRNKNSLTGRKETQPGESVQVTPKTRHSEIEKGSAQNNAQPDIPGISPILSGPTPAKVIHESSRRLQRPSQRPSLVPRGTQSRKSVGSTQQVTKEHPVRSPASPRITEGTHDEASLKEDNIQHELDPGRAPIPRAIASTEYSATSFIEEEILERMRLIIKKAGEKSGEKSGEKVIRDVKYSTPNGRILTRGLMRLISKYTAMNDLRSANVVDSGKMNMEHGKALKFLDIIREKTQEVLNDRLGDRELGGRNADEESRSHMLTDLYLHVIPHLVEALYCAVHSRQARDALEVSDLEEFYAILKILHDIVKASRAEDKTVQPKAPRNNSYSISQPTRILWPILRILYGQCEKKLAARKLAMRAEQLRKALPDRARKRKERLEAEEREEEAQFQYRLRERNKAIIASLDERRAELGLPPCSQPIEAPSTSPRHQTTTYMAEDSFNDVDHNTDRRLTGVFGRNNSHPGTTPKEWTKAEMEILVAGLRRERGPTRYEKLAAKLDRTLDEIFDRAKYLKMQMEYTLKRLQEENPDEDFPPVKPWIENVGSEGFLY